MNSVNFTICPKCCSERVAADECISSEGCPRCGVVSKKEVETINELKRLENIAAYEKMIQSKKNRLFVYTMGMTIILLGAITFYLVQEQVIANDPTTALDLESISLFVRPDEPFPATHYLVYTAEDCIARFEFRSNDGQDRVILLYDQANGKHIFKAYVKAGETLESMVPAGTYTFRVISGHTWLDEERHFGLDTRYQEGLHELKFINGSTGMERGLIMSADDGNFPLKPVGRAVLGF
jgi:hypothetical protein